jgi:alpha-beta hydrolase superfamily lysophospholipase
MLEPLAEAKVPILHLSGDNDAVVPYEENAAIIKQRYEQLGGPIQVILKEKCGHQPCGLEDPEPILNFIRKNKGK